MHFQEHHSMTRFKGREHPQDGASIAVILWVAIIFGY